MQLFRMSRAAAISAGLALAAGIAMGPATAVWAKPGPPHKFVLTDDSSPVARIHQRTCPQLTQQLIALVRLHGLSAQVVNCHVAATGPAETVAALSSLGELPGFSNIAYYDRANEQGNGIIVFVPDNDSGCDVVGINGDTAVNFEDSANQAWATSTPGYAGVDAIDQQGTDRNIPPTSNFAAAPAAVACIRAMTRENQRR